MSGQGFESAALAQGDASGNRNVVICCDGTGNEIERDLSNVLKLYRVADKSPGQLVYYDPGIGTMELKGGWGRARRKVAGVLALATGAGLAANLRDAYAFLCRTWREGDRIFLFGYSRGAYTVRALAGLVHMVGLLRPEQLDLCRAAVGAYLAADEHGLEEAWRFRRIVDGRPATIHFMGLWDTVASVLSPTGSFPSVPAQQHLPYTKNNPSVRAVRQACALDERRRMFRLYRWGDERLFRPGPDASAVTQDVEEVWFAGAHGDVGGGHAEAESGLAKLPLEWMVGEAVAAGLLVGAARVDAVVRGMPGSGPERFAAPDAQGAMHPSLTWGWWPLELLPKANRWRRWPQKTSARGVYLPKGEPRLVPAGAGVHASVRQRMTTMPGYRPVNVPGPYIVVLRPSRPSARRRPEDDGSGPSGFPARPRA